MKSVWACSVLLLFTQSCSLKIKSRRTFPTSAPKYDPFCSDVTTVSTRGSLWMLEGSLQHKSNKLTSPAASWTFYCFFFLHAPIRSCSDTLCYMFAPKSNIDYKKHGRGKKNKMKQWKFSASEWKQKKVSGFSLKTNYQKQTETNNLLPPPPPPPPTWRRHPAAINRRKYEKRKNNINRTGGWNFTVRPKNEKWHNKAILLKSHLTVNKSNDFTGASCRRARGCSGSNASYFYALTSTWKQNEKCVEGRGGGNMKNNCCLSHLWLNEIWWLLLMWPRLRYYLLLEVMAGLDKTHIWERRGHFLICCRKSASPAVSLTLHLQRTHLLHTLYTQLTHYTLNTHTTYMLHTHYTIHKRPLQ